MLFNSYEFIFIFLPLVLVLYYALPIKFKVLFLLLVSYVFYGYWNYNFIPLLILSTYIDYQIGIKIEDANTESNRRGLVIASVVMNLGLLGFFKYFNFGLDNINMILTSMGYDKLSHTMEIILPVGISFYTFQSMSYTIDLYRNNSKAYRSFLPFATYVSLFPQLVAGPIVRHDELVDQIVQSTRKRFSSDSFAKGMTFFIFGLAKKIVIADNIANAINPALKQMDVINSLEAWMCALGYTFQLYFDFSGYSDMAIGLGLMFGLKFPQNFNSPYKSYSITDFWRRWHMTLSFWLRDYLYISLGGNRGGKYKTYRNLFLTMLLGGLWHGAAWTFVLWGAFHGLVLGIERKLKLNKLSEKKIGRIFQYSITFLLIICGWVIFRSESIAQMTIWFKKLFILDFEMSYKIFKASTRDRYATALIIGMILTWACNNTNIIHTMKFNKKKPIYLAVLFYISILFLSKDSPFLYFQF